MNSPEPTWPPSPDLRAWRPAAYDDQDTIAVSALVAHEGSKPDWLADTEADVDGETACTQLVSVTLASVLGNALWVYAVPHREGGHRVVVTDDEGSSFTPPLARSDEPLTLGELQAVLDDTRGDGAAPGGIGHAWREYNLVDGVSRAELVDLVSISSETYPQLNALDRSRAVQWAAEEGDATDEG